MRYALLTSPESFVDEIDLIEKIFDIGLDALYIRKPNLSERALDRFLLSLAEPIREQSFLCGSPSKALEFGLLGFHVSANFCVRNADATMRASGLLSVYAENQDDWRKIPEDVLCKVSTLVVDSLDGFPGSAFVASDATELPADAENFFITSGIWEFADPVSAWRRLCGR